MIHLIHLVTFWTDLNQNTRKHFFIHTGNEQSHLAPIIIETKDSKILLELITDLNQSKTSLTESYRMIPECLVIHESFPLIHLVSFWTDSNQ